MLGLAVHHHLFESILDHLSWRDICSLCSVCRTLHDTVDRASCWKRALESAGFPVTQPFHSVVLSWLNARRLSFQLVELSSSLEEVDSLRVCCVRGKAALMHLGTKTKEEIVHVSSLFGMREARVLFARDPTRVSAE